MYCLQPRMGNVHVRLCNSLRFLNVNNKIKTPMPSSAKDALLGSGTPVGTEVIIASSKANDPPAGSPEIVTKEIPLAELSCNNSLGLLPDIPESDSLLEKSEVADASRLFPASKAFSEIGRASCRERSELDRKSVV